MKYCIEFGVRGGFHTDNIVVSGKETAAKICSSLVMVFENSNEIESSKKKTWMLKDNNPRMSWTSSSHFVALSKLDGVDRGPASPELWKKEEVNTVMMDILSIDAWNNGDGWDWNQCWKVGEISKEEFKELNTDEKILEFFCKDYITFADLCGVEDDEYNKVITEKSNGKPLYAIEYGKHY